jgi:hypothetical protein
MNGIHVGLHPYLFYYCPWFLLQPNPTPSDHLRSGVLKDLGTIFLKKTTASAEASKSGARVAQDAEVVRV